MIIQGSLRRQVNALSVKQQSVQNLESLKGASITIPLAADEVLFITGAFGDAITEITENAVATGLKPSGSLNFPWLRFDRAVVITGGAATVVTFFKMKGN